VILNFSSLDLFEQCKHKYLKRQIQRLQPPAVLTMERGAGGHAGVSYFHKTGNVHEAVEMADMSIREVMEKQAILPEERPLWERAIVSARAGVREYAKVYAEKNYTVLRTEVRFLVPIPNTEHHCPFFHEILYPGIPYRDCVYDDWVGSSLHYEDKNDEPPACYQPHYLAGTTDQVVSLNSVIWLIDLKFSGFRQESFFSQFLLDMQGTVYCYGIKAAAGIEPHGFIIYKIDMPWKNQDPEKVSVQSEGYLREPADYQRMLKWATDIGNEIEDLYTRPKSEYNDAFRVNPRSCYNYNRECWYHKICVNHDDPGVEDEFEIAPLRYPEVDYYLLLLADRQLQRGWADLPPEVRESIHEEALSASS
jgi:hypothetical protein